MTQFRVIADHVIDDADGKPLMPFSVVTVDEKHPHNVALIDDGRLVPEDKPKRRRSAADKTTQDGDD